MSPKIGILDGIRYIEVGPANATTAPGCLFLHGLGGSLHQWWEVQRELETTYRTVAVDIPGFGKNRKNTYKFDIGTAAEEIAVFCRSLGLTHCVLVSHSIGSVVAGLLARRLPHIFTQVIFVSGSLFHASAIARHPLLALRRPKLGFMVATQFMAGMFPLPGFARQLIVRSPIVRRLALWPFVAHPAQLDPAVLATSLEGVGSPATLRILLTAKSIDYVSIMSSIAQPVRLVWGSLDRIITAEDIALMRQTVSVTDALEIADCGHWPMIEQPHDVVAFIMMRGPDASSDDQRLRRL